MYKIAAGIVLFNPEINRLKENIESIINQVDLLILIDNYSDNQTDLNSLIKDYNQSLIIVKNKKNHGIAYALNQIVYYSEKEGYEWVLTLDQDSVAPYNLVDNYKKWILYDENAGIFTVRIVDRNYAEETTNCIERSQLQYVEKCITSASLINIEKSAKIGHFDEDMFIDLVDFDYCIRMRDAGYKIIRLNNITLLHQLGNLKVSRILGKEIRLTNHSPIRNYYLARNTIYIAKKHPDYYKRKDTYKSIFKMIIKIVFFENQKIVKLKSVFRGVEDGVSMNK